MAYRFIICLILSLILFSNCSRVDERKKEGLSPDKASVLNDSLEALENSFAVNHNKDAKESIELARKGLYIANLNKDPRMLIKANIIYGSILIENKPDSAYYFIKEALDKSNQTGKTEFKQEIYYNLAKIHKESMDYKLAIIYLDSVIRYKEIPVKYELVSNAYNDLGVIKSDLHDYVDAKRLFDSSFKIASSHALELQRGVAMGNLAAFEKDTASAFAMLKEALKVLLKAPGSGDAISQIRINLGNRSSNSDSAIAYYTAAIRGVDTSSSNEELLIAYNNLVYSYIDKKEFDLARDCITRKAIPMAERWNNADWLATLYDTYSDLLQAEGKDHEAVHAEKKAYQYREIAYDLKVTGQLRLLALLLDVKDKELRIQSEQQVSQGKTNRIRVLAIIVAILLIFLVLLWIWGRQRNKLLLERQRLDSARKILAMDETFRSRMALELHDMTSPLYTGILRQIEEVSIDDHSIKEHLIISLNELAGNIRSISHKMAGGYFEDLPLRLLIESLCHEMQYRTNAQIRLRMEMSEIIMKKDKMHHVIRIIQELLSNGVKFVKEGEIQLSISEELGDLNIIYHDNGNGFSIENAEGKGLGLTSIVERANLVRGKALLTSEPGNGTHWTIRIPLG
jgi:signal transduction histidine kinase